MPAPVKLSKADARRALVRHHFTPAQNMAEVFDRLRSIQFDPIAPVGCNHDLVLQARLDNYQVGDWETHAYDERKIYDGWDKMASLVPYEGWPLRRVFHDASRAGNPKVFQEHPDAIEAILREIEARGPLLPRECEFQAQRPDWKGSWNGSSVTKQALRALWRTGQVMTAGRRKGQHLYDLTERVVPPDLFSQPQLSEEEAVKELVFERHRAVGLLRPSSPYEVWSYFIMVPERKVAIASLIEEGKLVPVNVEGVTAHATPEFLTLLDQPSLEPKVTFIAPLDQFMWDRKMIAHLFDFDYVWEIYTPEVKRRWGYYVLPIRYGDHLVARAEFWCRNGLLELRRWHTEGETLPAGFTESLKPAVERFMAYCRANELRSEPGLAHPL
jgi:uncharacterized protein YcaQ